MRRLKRSKVEVSVEIGKNKNYRPLIFGNCSKRDLKLFLCKALIAL